MFRLSGKTTVARSAADVSTFLADVANEPKWQKDIVHVQLVAGKAGEKGATYERVQLVAGRNIKTMNEVEAVTPGERIRFQAKGKVIEYALEYTFASKGATTDVSMALEGEMLGFAAMFEGVAADELRAAIPANLERLKKALET